MISDVAKRGRQLADRLVDPNPFDSAEQRRTWRVAGEVSRGPVSQVHTMVWLERARESHRLHEGIQTDDVLEEVSR